MKMTLAHFFPFLVPSMAALLISFSFFLPGLSAHPETARLIQDICRRVDDVQFCNATMYANLQADIADLSKLAISVALKYATDTKEYVDEVTRQQIDKDLIFILTICSNAYGVVIDSFTTAEQQFGGGYYTDALESEKKAVQPMNDCDNAFTMPSPRPNVLWDRNGRMKDLIQIAIIALKNNLP